MTTTRFRPLLAALALLIGLSGQVLAQATGSAGYPPGAIPVSAVFASNVGAAPGTASIGAAAGKFSYLCGLSALNNGATAAAAGATLTISGLSGSTTQTYLFPFAAAGTFTVFPTNSQPVGFAPCLISNAVNTAITVTVGTQAGNTITDINVWGYQQ